MSEVPPVRRRGPPRRVEVSRVQTLSPAMRRVTLSGESLASFPPPAPASYIKLIFPEAGQTEPPMPEPDGPRPASIRTYTPRRYDPVARELEVDFVLHGDGPASTWAAQAQPGQVLLMMGPGPGYTLDTTAASHLLIGDDSALPAMETILANLPASSRALVLMEVLDAAEERVLDSAATLEVRWLHRGADNTQAGQASIAAVRAQAELVRQLPQACRVYLACEAAAMRRIRAVLTDELGVARARIVARGYWKLGAVNHPDHDYGE